ncbi:methyltransferase domain-containing protein [Shewanella sp. AS1]|uniref:methyltransferase domain-containing protein n=1 Tax=Shewanella sp. AS1 TaxID=2907626 RepID=UPI001F418281|nr:methyltransferase domain-containing protein [Shewanella sp. AS1]MCE9678942.1 methyltransferase domain-containing protein [Shewanella sp. AS1]
MPLNETSSASALSQAQVQAEAQPQKPADEHSQPHTQEPLSQARIAKQFSQAASHYQQHDVVQRLSAKQLLDQMLNGQMFKEKGCLLDIGCGPGTAFNHTDIGQVIALDIAPGMLTQMSARFPNYLPVCADAQSLPLKAQSVDTIYSNLALQWSQNLPQAIGEMARVLRVGGECHLAIVAKGSLPQLTQLGFRVNEFLDHNGILACFDERWQVTSRLETITVHFEDLKSLLYSIKGVGASVAAKSDSTSVHKLRGREDWRDRQARAQQMREAQGIPLSYQILFIRGQLIPGQLISGQLIPGQLKG